MARVNRRGDLLSAALDLFMQRGYQGTSVADLAKATGLSKAAFVYHFGSKEELLFELSAPLLDALDEVIDDHEKRRPNGHDVEAVLDDYLHALHRHRGVARWIDGDKSVLNHGDLGARIDANNRRVHRLLCGPRPTKTNRALASSVLGMLWRPIRNDYLPDNAKSRRAVVELASQAARSL